MAVDGRRRVGGGRNRARGTWTPARGRTCPPPFTFSYDVHGARSTACDATAAAFTTLYTLQLTHAPPPVTTSTATAAAAADTRATFRCCFLSARVSGVYVLPTRATVCVCVCSARCVSLFRERSRRIPACCYYYCTTAAAVTGASLGRATATSSTGKLKKKLTAVEQQQSRFPDYRVSAAAVRCAPVGFDTRI